MKSATAEVRMIEASWHQKIARARELRGKSMALLYDRVAILCEVYADREFLDSFTTLDAAIEALDVELADYDWSFFTFQGILKMFPDRKQWASAKLQDLRAQHEVAEKERRELARQDSGEPTTQRRKRATVEEVEELREQSATATHRAESQEKQIDRLLQENAELRRQLHIAQGRIEELERRHA